MTSRSSSVRRSAARRAANGSSSSRSSEMAVRSRGSSAATNIPRRGYTSTRCSFDEPAQRLSDGGAAHAQPVLQVRLADHGARRELEGDDQPTDVAVGALGQRLVAGEIGLDEDGDGHGHRYISYRSPVHQFPLVECAVVRPSERAVTSAAAAHSTNGALEGIDGRARGRGRDRPRGAPAAPRAGARGARRPGRRRARDRSSGGRPATRRGCSAGSSRRAARGCRSSPSSRHTSRSNPATRKSVRKYVPGCSSERRATTSAPA